MDQQSVFHYVCDGGDANQWRVLLVHCFQFHSQTKARRCDRLRNRTPWKGNQPPSWSSCWNPPYKLLWPQKSQTKTHYSDYQEVCRQDFWQWLLLLLKKSKCGSKNSISRYTHHCRLPGWDIVQWFAEDNGYCTSCFTGGNVRRVFKEMKWLSGKQGRAGFWSYWSQWLSMCSFQPPACGLHVTPVTLNGMEDFMGTEVNNHWESTSGEGWQMLKTHSPIMNPTAHMSMLPENRNYFGNY